MCGSDLFVRIIGGGEMRGSPRKVAGDYGFAWTPHGTNAKDLEYFVELIGMSPMEAIVSATRLGGEIMGRPDELGMVCENYLADLILVDGDPVADVRVLQEHDRLTAIMKGGVFYKSPPSR